MFVSFQYTLRLHCFPRPSSSAFILLSYTYTISGNICVCPTYCSTPLLLLATFFCFQLPVVHQHLRRPCSPPFNFALRKHESRQFLYRPTHCQTRTFILETFALSNLMSYTSTYLGHIRPRSNFLSYISTYVGHVSFRHTYFSKSTLTPAIFVSAHITALHQDLSRPCFSLSNLLSYTSVYCLSLFKSAQPNELHSLLSSSLCITLQLQKLINWYIYIKYDGVWLHCVILIPFHTQSFINITNGRPENQDSIPGESILVPRPTVPPN
jgi:hypothetical protein